LFFTRVSPPDAPIVIYIKLNVNYILQISIYNGKNGCASGPGEGERYAARRDVSVCPGR
jgi:hypothetical protein